MNKANTEKLFTAQEIEELLTIPCCHTSGTHDPEHYSKGKYICRDQIAEAFENLCRVLEINPVVKHKDNCGWCRDHPEKTKGDGKEFWDQPNVCARCGNGKYMHDDRDYQLDCKGFVPLSFKTMKKYKKERMKSN